MTQNDVLYTYEEYMERAWAALMALESFIALDPDKASREMLETRDELRGLCGLPID